MYDDVIYDGVLYDSLLYNGVLWDGVLYYTMVYTILCCRELGTVLYDGIYCIVLLCIVLYCRELGTVAHEAIINHRRNKRSRDERRDSISTCLFKSHQDIRGAGSTHPSPAHGALLRIKADQYVAEDQITLDSINDTIWGQVVEGRPEGDERRHTQDLRQYRSAIEMRYKTSPLHLPYLLLPRRHSFDALDSARCNSDRSTCARSNHARSNRGRSQPTYATSDNKRNSIACSPPQTDSDDGRLRDVDCESMLDYGLLQINIENYDDLISEDKDSIMSECSSDQSTNQSTGFHITS